VQETTTTDTPETYESTTGAQSTTSAQMFDATPMTTQTEGILNQPAGLSSESIPQNDIDIDIVSTNLPDNNLLGEVIYYVSETTYIIPQQQQHLQPHLQPHIPIDQYYNGQTQEVVGTNTLPTTTIDNGTGDQLPEDTDEIASEDNNIVDSTDTTVTTASQISTLPDEATTTTQDLFTSKLPVYNIFVVEGTMATALRWIADLADTSSEIYKQEEKLLCSSLKEATTTLFSSSACTVIQFVQTTLTMRSTDSIFTEVEYWFAAPSKAIEATIFEQEYSIHLKSPQAIRILAKQGYVDSGSYNVTQLDVDVEEGACVTVKELFEVCGFSESIYFTFFILVLGVMLP